MIKCKECKKDFKSVQGLRIHNGRMHKVSMAELETMEARNAILSRIDDCKGDSL